ncbi:class I SAM-dependent methyltransferase [bacterium]|nr:class I SAM-dependent methyltransferase [bacterium]
MAEKHYFEQKRHTVSYLIPYFESHIPEFRSKRVLEIGCAEAGFLAELHRIGIDCLGVELEPSRVRTALAKVPDLRIITGDITDPAVVASIGDRFDLIVLRDVIEHIPGRTALFAAVLRLLKPGGMVYISFPPRCSAFAGHQQNGRSPLRFVPWLQLWPRPLLDAAGRLLREAPYMIRCIHENGRTGLSVAAFDRLWKGAGMRPLVYDLFVSRPVYRTRYGVPVLRFPAIPLLREVLATGCETLLQLPA